MDISQHREYAIAATEELVVKLGAGLIHQPSGMIDTHGGDPLGSAKAIVDSFLNAPLLLTGEASTDEFAAAVHHERRLIEHLRVRPGHWFQGGIFDAHGNFERPFTKQGHQADSTGWSRGLAWVSYGLRLTRDLAPQIVAELNIADEIAALNNRLLAPGRSDLPAWDLAADDLRAKDSGALAIALAGQLQDDGNEAMLAANYALLVQSQAVLSDPCHGGLLTKSTYHRPNGFGINGVTSWGDYFYLEALLQPTGFRSPYRWLV